MSVLDQAFMKAYARQTASARKPSSTSIDPPVVRSSDSRDLGEVGSQPTSFAADPGQGAVWIDPLDDRFVRADGPGTANQSHPRSPQHRGSVTHPAPQPIPQPVPETLVPAEAASAFPLQADVDEAVQAAIEAAMASASAALATQVVALRSAQDHTAERSTSDAGFNSVWEVDALEFDERIIALFGNHSLMRSIGVPLDRAVSDGLRTVLITSDAAGAGRTTVAIGIAVSAAAAGLRVALVDGDYAGPSLADALRLDVQYGWVEAVRCGLAVSEVAIHSIEDQLTVIPMLPMAGQQTPSADEYSRMMSPLRAAFDLVIVDGGPLTRENAEHGSLVGIDSAIVVQDCRRSRSRILEVMNTLRVRRVAGLGIVQNYVQ